LEYLETSLAAPAAGTYGNGSYNSVEGPGFWQWDQAVSREFQIKDRPPDLDMEFPLVKENRMSRTRAKARDYMRACTLSRACSRGL